MQDETIVDLYWKRDESAISETERKYGRYLSKIAYNILSDWEDSKETVNDAYLKAWNSMPTHKPSVLSTYLGKITRQLSIDAFRTRNRDKRKHSEYAVSLSELEDCISGSETTEQSIELKLLAEAINTYLYTLPAEARNTFVGRYYFADPVREVADYYGMSEPKVKSRDTLLAIRRDLNGIKDCRTEFLLSRAMTLAAQIDEDRIKKLLREVQNRIDFLNLTTKPIDLMTVVSNEEVVKIVYEFFKVKISIMDMSKLTKAFKDVSDIDGYKQFTDAVTDIQKEIRRNKNTGAEKIVSLEDLLKKIFVELEYIDLNNLSEVNGKLLKILEDLRCINEENERLAARYGGNYAFVKTYSDVVEMHPEFDKEDLAKLTDVAYAAVKDIEGSNILILHGRESFVNTVKKNTTTQLLKSGLYKKLNLKDWYADFLGETYSNMRIF